MNELNEFWMELNEFNEFGIACCDILSSQLSVIF